MANDPISKAIDIERAERETLRWVLVTALWYARPYGALEGLLVSCAHDIPLRASSHDVRRELSWLDSHGLVQLDTRGPVWSAKLSALGEDVYEYRAEAPAGLARPKRW